jgi:hypothetical protein
MVFDPTVSLGNLIALFGFLAAGTAAFYAMKADIHGLLSRVGGMESHLSKLTDVIVADARHEARLDALEHRVDRLEKHQ